MKNTVFAVKLSFLLVFVLLSITFLHSNCYAISLEALKSELVANSKIDLISAIKIATNSIPGQPIGAHLDAQSTGPVYVVIILKNNSSEIVNVSVDGKTGNITQTAPRTTDTAPTFVIIYKQPTVPDVPR
jgi:hypothetical protein